MSVLEVLRADAEHDPLARVVAQRRARLERLGGERQRLAAERDRPAVAVDRDARVVQVHRRRPDERRDEDVRRTVVEVLRRVDLLQVAVLDDRHPVAHRHRLDLVVGDVEGGDAELALQVGDLGTHLHAQLGVEVRQRLVHEERGGLAHDRTAHRDALALTTRQLARLAVEVLGELEVSAALRTRWSISSLGTLASFSAKPMLSYTDMCGYSA
jgi:hypothetical protein